MIMPPCCDEASISSCKVKISVQPKNKMQPTNANAHTYVNGDDGETHGYAATQNTFLK